METLDTFKFRLGLAVSFFAMSTTVARLARIFRTNGNNLNSIQFSFVFEKISELKKTPTTNFSPLRFPKPFFDSSSNAFKIFDGNSSISAFGCLNEFFRYFVVCQLAKVFLSLSDSFEKFVDRTRTLSALRLLTCFVLKQLSPVGVFQANGFNIFSAKRFSVRRGCDVHHAEVNADNVIGNYRIIFRHVANGIKKELTFAVNQINFAFQKRQKFSLMFTANKRNCLPSVQSPKRNFIAAFESQNAAVVSNRTVLSKFGLLLFLNLVTVGNFANRSNGHLGTKLKFRLSFLIDNFVNVELFENLIIESLFANPITRFVGTLKRLQQIPVLAFERLQFKINNQLHSSIVENLVCKCKLKRIQKPIRNALLPHQTQSGLEGVSALIFYEYRRH